MIRLLSVQLTQHSALLVPQTQMKSPLYKAKEYGLHSIACVYIIVHVNCHACTYFLPKKTVMYIFVWYISSFVKKSFVTNNYIEFQLCKVLLCYRIIVWTLVSDLTECTDETFEIYCSLTGNISMLLISTLHSTIHQIYLQVFKDEIAEKIFHLLLYHDKWEYLPHNSYPKLHYISNIQHMHYFLPSKDCWFKTLSESIYF